MRVPPLDKPHRTQQVGLGPTTPYINDAPGSILKGRGAKKRRLCEGRVNESRMRGFTAWKASAQEVLKWMKNAPQSDLRLTRQAPLQAPGLVQRG